MGIKVINESCKENEMPYKFDGNKMVGSIQMFHNQAPSYRFAHILSVSIAYIISINLRYFLFIYTHACLLLYFKLFYQVFMLVKSFIVKTVAHDLLTCVFFSTFHFG